MTEIDCTCDHDDDEGITRMDTACPTHGADAGLEGAKARALAALADWALAAIQDGVVEIDTEANTVTIRVTKDLL